MSYRFEYPIRYSSISLAHSLPSAIAQTTSDWPLCMSPAVKTLSVPVKYESAPEVAIVFLGERGTPNAFAV